ncbi:MAG: hypothetical protein LBJ88_01295 [Campylobacteraceae bacterium]|jgi:hypothetical protein|nr:hypothetical protein [Campylobacteraceae bacterium]
MTIDETREKLNSKKSSERRRAVIEIGKNKMAELGEELYQKYLEERKDKRTWETQCEMVKALGVIDFKKALEIIEEIVKQNIPHDMITINAALSYVRLKRQSLQDGNLVVELLKFGNFSVIEGAVMALAYDQMKPDNESAEKIIKLSWDWRNEKGYGDNRKYVAIACWNWDKKLTESFLNHCIETADQYDNNLKEICQNSLKGKYSKSYLSKY